MMDNEKLNIAKEIETLSPILAKIKKPVRKDIPDGYFETVEAQILSQISIINHQSPKIEVPEGYFANLENQIMQNVGIDDVKVLPFYKRVSFRILAAASIVFILVFTGIQLLTTDNTTNPELSVMAQPNEAEYFQYLQHNIEEIDINMLIENDLIEESDLTVVTYNDINELDDDDPSFLFDSGIDF